MGEESLRWQDKLQGGSLAAYSMLHHDPYYFNRNNNNNIDR